MGSHDISKYEVCVVALDVSDVLLSRADGPSRRTFDLSLVRDAFGACSIFRPLVIEAPLARRGVFGAFLRAIGDLRAIPDFVAAFARARRFVVLAGFEARRLAPVLVVPTAPLAVAARLFLVALVEAVREEAFAVEGFATLFFAVLTFLEPVFGVLPFLAFVFEVLAFLAACMDDLRERISCMQRAGASRDMCAAEAVRRYGDKMVPRLSNG